MKPEKTQTQNQPTPRFISAYSPKLKISLIFPAQGRTKQSFKNECDINTIMSRYMSTGQLPDLLNSGNPQFLDVTGIDYQEAMQTVAQAKTLFEELPSAIRLRFKNDPAAFLNFTSDENNRQELAEMGLLRPEAIARMATPQPEETNAATALKTPKAKEPPQEA